jgi:hypothetical protein
MEDEEEEEGGGADSTEATVTSVWGFDKVTKDVENGGWTCGKKKTSDTNLRTHRQVASALPLSYLTLV